jgi:hypothetical protein
MQHRKNSLTANLSANYVSAQSNLDLFCDRLLGTNQSKDPANP